MSAPLAVSPAARQAIARGRPVVALETTVVTHGLPRPEGLAAARACEAAVRAAGAVPATVGILGGRVRVGLEADELERLAAAPEVRKVGLGNLAASVAGGGAGSTTVAATLWAAWRAGIRVLATGGIGGVHRGAGESGDVSADLAALARFPVAVVCAGAKAILDLGRTLEALESLGVPVLGLGSDRFPAFYRRDSGLPVDRGYEEIGPLAAAVAAHFALDLGTGLVVAVPIPAEHELPRELYESALESAERDLRASGLRGRAVTPFLLERLRDLTAGRSVFSNRALLEHNARTAGRLAAALAAAAPREE